MKFLDKFKRNKIKDEDIKNINNMPELENDETVIDSLNLEDTPERKTRGYNTYYKKKINKKKLISRILLIILPIILIISIIFLVKIINYKGPTEVKEEIIELTEMEKTAKTIQQTISQGYTIGKTTKDEIVASGIKFHDVSGQNFLIKKDYTSINEIDHLTTFIFENNILTSIVHEALLDNSTKYKLATYFQNFSSYINIGYKDIKLSERWFIEPQKYNVENWNNSLINNNLELMSEYTDENNYIKIIASGIPYVDFLMSTRNDQNFGNLTIFYTNKNNSSQFENLENLKFE